MHETLIKRIIELKERYMSLAHKFNNKDNEFSIFYIVNFV